MPSTRVQLPPWGTRRHQVETVAVCTASFVLAAIYVLVAETLETTTSRLEFWSLVFSFACVWLSRTENLFSMHTGIASSVLMGVFLLRIEVVAQGWLQFAYYVPVQLWGWWMWCRGGDGRTELPVTKLTRRGWFVCVGVFVLVWVAVALLFEVAYDSPRLLPWDSSIVAASIVAQSLMTMKKVESWLFWIAPVNISSIAFFMYTDVPAFAVMYAVFLLNASFGLRNWRRSNMRDVV